MAKAEHQQIFAQVFEINGRVGAHGDGIQCVVLPFTSATVIDRSRKIIRNIRGPTKLMDNIQFAELDRDARRLRPKKRALLALAHNARRGL